eukprot:27905-Pelagococcus_subviridis.AAC.2
MGEKLLYRTHLIREVAGHHPVHLHRDQRVARLQRLHVLLPQHVPAAGALDDDASESHRADAAAAVKPDGAHEVLRDAHAEGRSIRSDVGVELKGVSWS